MGKLYVKGFSRKDKRVKELGATAFWQLPPNVCQLDKIPYAWWG